MPGLINWALSMSDTDMINCIKNTSVAVPSLNQAKVESLYNSESLMAWLEDNVTYAKNGAREKIGDKEIVLSEDGLRVYKGQDDELYPNYCHYCEVNGMQPLSQRLFSNAVVDKANNVLGLKEVKKVRDAKGRYITHVLLKRSHDHLPGLVSYSLLPHDDGSMSDDDRYMTAKSTDCAGFDENDASFLETCRKELEKYEEGSGDDDSFIPPELQISNAEIAVHPTNPAPVSDSADTTSDINAAQPSTADDDELKEGDKVYLQNCPGNCEWAQPFTVLAIKDNYAQLELFEKPVLVSRLSKNT